MAYIDPLDPSTPTDLAPSGEGDDRIRELKRALIERFSTVFSNFPDGDPLELIASIVSEGTLADRPNPPSTAGLLYWATDTKQLFISTGDPAAWFEFRAGSGIDLLANRPNPPTAEGQLFYATDESKLYISQDDGAGSFEWITNASTLVRETQLIEDIPVDNSASVTRTFIFNLASENSLALSWRVRGKNGALDYGSWMHTAVADLIVAGPTLSEDVTLRIVDVRTAPDEPWRVIVLVRLTATTATTQFITVQAQIVVSEV